MKTIQKDGLRSRYKKSIIETISQNCRVKKIVLFGSRATGMFKVNSDIDLVLYGKKLTLDDLAEIIQSVSFLTVPQTVDIHIHHRITSDSLLKEIKENGVLWYERK